MRRFELHRHEDATGVSGTGVVAEGVVFKNGKIAVAWLTRHKSMTIYDDMATLEAIHGHGGMTEVVWHDPGLDDDLATVWSLIDGAPEAVEALKRVELALGVRELVPEKKPKIEFPCVCRTCGHGWDPGGVYPEKGGACPSCGEGGPRDEDG